VTVRGSARGPQVVAENVEKLFSERNYSVDGNGKRFLYFRRKSEAVSGPDRVAVVANWLDHLGRSR
jgi:hypothetical protein